MTDQLYEGLKEIRVAEKTSGWATADMIGKHLCVSPNTIRHWMRSGAMPHYRVRGRRLLDIAEVDQWVRSFKVNIKPIYKSRHKKYEEVSESLLTQAKQLGLTNAQAGEVIKSAAGLRKSFTIELKNL